MDFIFAELIVWSFSLGFKPWRPRILARSSPTANRGSCPRQFPQACHQSQPGI